MKKLGVFALAILILAPGNAFAGGFQIGEMATRATGMASAFTAVADDASAAWHNPAGIVFMEGAQIMLGADALFVPGTDFTSNSNNPSHPATTSTASKTFPIPHAYLSYHGADSDFAYSLGVNSPFGLETDWPATSTNPFNGKSTFSRIKLIAINPNVTYKISERLAIAVGVDYFNVPQVDLNNTVQLLSADGDGWGGNAAIFYKGDSFNFGISYRSRVSVPLEGTATSQGALATTFNAGTSAGTTKITFPDQVNVGLAFKPDDKWLVSLDVDWVNWKTYDKIDIYYASTTYLNALNNMRAALGGSAVSFAHTPENWKATVAFRMGAEWAYADDMRARIGYVYDPTPIRDVDFSPSIPGNDRHLLTLGYSYDFSKSSTIDLAYAFVYFEKRNQTASPVGDLAGSPNTVKNGIYEAMVHIAALSWTYHF